MNKEVGKEKGWGGERERGGGRGDHLGLSRQKIGMSTREKRRGNSTTMYRSSMKVEVGKGRRGREAFPETRGILIHLRSGEEAETRDPGYIFGKKVKNFLLLTLKYGEQTYCTYFFRDFV